MARIGRVHFLGRGGRTSTRRRDEYTWNSLGENADGVNCEVSCSCTRLSVNTPLTIDNI